ncbi:MAG: glycosyltransferase family 9 protein [Deltaproteobacteria bacterium]|nr:glycosyltransferase family 9 protein [Deltaproteobacteria bacterium]
MDNQKILVLRLSAVGDVIRTLPAVKAIKKNFPSASITWIVEETSKALVESQPEVEEVILFPRQRWSEGIRALKGWRTIGEVRTFIQSLRRKKFDLVLDFHGILKSGLLSFLSGSPQRIGYDRRSSKEGNFLFSNKKVKLPKERISRFERNFYLLKGMGLEVQPEDYPLFIPAEDRGYVNSFFNQLFPPLKSPSIAIHPGTSPKTLYKRWLPDKYAQLADQLVHELKATVLFTWGPGELEWVKMIQRRMKESSVLGPHTISLTQLGEVYRRCDLYIGGDTGPMHVASLMGIPVVVIYGPTDPVINGPFGPHKKVIKNVGCNPCRDRSCKELKCLKEIAVDDVFKATREVLAEKRGQATF